MNIIVDTSAYSAAQRANSSILNILDEAHQAYIPVIVVGELLAGFACGAKEVENKKLLSKFMSDPVVSMLHISDDTPRYFAEIYAELKGAGRPIGQNDLWIAALAREHQLPVLTLDKDFRAVKGLEILT